MFLRNTKRRKDIGRRTAEPSHEIDGIFIFIGNEKSNTQTNNPADGSDPRARRPSRGRGGNGRPQAELADGAREARPRRLPRSFRQRHYRVRREPLGFPGQLLEEAVHGRRVTPVRQQQQKPCRVLFIPRGGRERGFVRCLVCVFFVCAVVKKCSLMCIYPRRKKNILDEN